MRVLVTQVEPGESERLHVQTGDSAFTGTWRGEGQAPAAGAEADIEVTVEDACRWVSEAELAGSSPGSGTLAGTVEGEAEADGVVNLRVGDGLLMVEVPEDGRLPRPGERLSVLDARMTFWPTGI